MTAESPLVVAMRRLETIRDTHGIKMQHLCRCGAPWPCPDHADAVAALDALAKLATRDTQIAKHLDAIKHIADDKSNVSGNAFYAIAAERDFILALLDAKDGACQHCDGSGCEACDARHVPAKDGAS